jgi:hypothetical protein
MGKGAVRRASQKKTRSDAGFFYCFGESVHQLRICLPLSGSASRNDYLTKNVSLR